MTFTFHFIFFSLNPYDSIFVMQQPFETQNLLIIVPLMFTIILQVTYVNDHLILESYIRGKSSWGAWRTLKNLRNGGNNNINILGICLNEWKLYFNKLLNEDRTKFLMELLRKKIIKYRHYTFKCRDSRNSNCWSEEWKCGWCRSTKTNN